MPQLLESTRNYLKSSTKLGRRLSTYRDDSSASEASLSDALAAPSERAVPIETLKPQQQHRPSTQKRLSSLFALEGRNRNSISYEDRAAVNVLSRKIGPDANDATQQPDQKKKRRHSSGRKSSQSQHVSSSSAPAALSTADRRASSYTDRDQVPRGQSPTLSVANTMRSASSYDTRPDDYPTLDQYHSHVWRRTLLEESIMHSLMLGYGETSSRRRSLSRTLNRSPTPADSENTSPVIVNRSIPSAPVKRVLQPQQHQHQQQHGTVHKNSPYQALLNPSTTNITHSFASFTLELPEHQVTHVMSSSVVPNLFSIKMANANASRMLNTTSSGPTPRVLTGTANTVVSDEQAEFKENMLPLHPLQAVVAV
ncbi:hypothetical protein BGZ99_006747 [Dissophora globulifera]|uniref:Uncharacterized protein n=1 Tax=Dissophora globulifera TaxID=979702 RepID=A0A9P6RBD2_9FUNG|nr:hypothetical protein BGZ99_006747 [Dissophora globulifera]